MIKPYRTLLLLLMVNGLLALYIFLVPTGRLYLFKDFAIKFVSKEDLLNPKKVEYADINKIIAAQKNLNIDSAVSMSKGVADAIDTATVDTLVNPMDSIPNLADLLNLDYKIQYPEGQTDLMQPFFAELDALSTQKRLVRIVHYGDSQVEGDRISGTLRHRMQSQFGGCGPGTVPVFDVADIRSSISIKCSDNWKKYATYGGLYKGVKTNHYGIQGSIFRIKQSIDTVTGKPISGTHKAWVSFKENHLAHRETRRFEQVNLYFGNTSETVKVRITKGKDQVIQDTLIKEANFGHKTWAIDSLKSGLKFEFTTTGSFDVYGFGFDCKSGIAVDNVPMRGSSGLDFMRIQPSFLAQQMWALDTKLLILQFGVNVAPNELEHYEFYERAYYKQLKALRENLPGVVILVVGISDVSQKKDGVYSTGPHIEKIRNAQRNAAFKAGCPFWDLFEAMGGANSMPSWVAAKPSLAQQDYTHFNAQGAKVIGEMLYNALMSEYVAYKTVAKR